MRVLAFDGRHIERGRQIRDNRIEQRLNTWLWDAVQAGHECVYDPICADDGGSCAGCTYREHNCVMFNRELSRSTLYGGPTPHHSEFGGLALTQGYWSQAWQVTPIA